MGTPVLVNYYAWEAENVAQKLFTRGYRAGITILNKVKARKKIDEAGKSLDDAQDRNRIIQKKLKNIEEIDSSAADDYLGIEEVTEVEWDAEKWKNNFTDDPERKGGTLLR